MSAEEERFDDAVEASADSDETIVLPGRGRQPETLIADDQTVAVSRRRRRKLLSSPQSKQSAPRQHLRAGDVTSRGVRAVPTRPARARPDFFGTGSQRELYGGKILARSKRFRRWVLLTQIGGILVGVAGLFWVLTEGLASIH